jgi:hypothetical protein
VAQGDESHVGQRVRGPWGRVAHGGDGRGAVQDADWQDHERVLSEKGVVKLGAGAFG